MHCITDVAATVSSLLGFASPNGGEPMAEVTSLFKDGRADRVLMYNPDAVAWWVFTKYRDKFAKCLARDPLVMEMRSVMPSVTPVCFASMYSGLTPDGHGIKCYTKPVLACQTLFDAAIAAGIRPAIVSETGASVSMIFREREMDYYIYDSVGEVTRKALELIRGGTHRLVVAYHGDYDHFMHRNGPEGDEALAALDANAEAYCALCDAAAESWGGKGLSWAAAFATDHGCHLIDGGCGSHGLDMPEDMEVAHLWTAGK